MAEIFIKLRNAAFERAMLESALAIEKDVNEFVSSGEMDKQIDIELKSEETFWDKILNKFIKD